MLGDMLAMQLAGAIHLSRAMAELIVKLGQMSTQYVGAGGRDALLNTHWGLCYRCR